MGNRVRPTRVASSPPRSSVGLMRLGLFLVMALALGPHGTCASVELTQEFHAREGFTIRLPADWKQIPPDVIKKYFSEMTRANPQMPRAVANYAFKPASNMNPLPFPYLMIQVDHSGKLPEQRLADTRQMKRGIEKGARDASSKLSDVTASELTYDADRHIVWGTLQMTVPDGGRLKQMLATIMTEQGVIRVVGFSTDEDYETWAPTFKAIAENLVLSEKLRYRPAADPRNTPSWMTLGALILLIVCAFFVAVVAGKDKTADRKWTWAACVVSLGIYVGTYAELKPDISISVMIRRILDSALIPALVLFMAATWPSWRRKRIGQNNNTPEVRESGEDST